MKKLFISLISIFLVLIATSPAWADFAADHWQFYKSLDQINSGKFALVDLDGEIFNHSNKQLADLRVIDQKGQEIPYYLIAKHKDRSETAYQSQLMNNSIVPGKYTSFILDLQNLSGIPYDRINIDTTSKDFLRRVELAGSNDQKHWQQIGSDHLIYSVEGKVNTTLNFDLCNFTFLRVRIWNQTEKPLEIVGAKVFATKNDPMPAPKVIPGTIMSQSEDAVHKKNVIKIDLGYGNMPSNQVRLAIKDANFQRQVEISGSNDGQKWFASGNDLIYATNIDNFKFNKNLLNYPESWYRYLRITIYNQDNQPLKVSGAEVLGEPKRLVFPVETGNTYQLFYGNPKAQVPQYDFKDFASYIKVNSLPVVHLGQEQFNPRFNVRTQRPWTEDHHWLLVSALVVVVAVLGTFIIKLMKNIGNEENV